MDEGIDRSLHPGAARPLGPEPAGRPPGATAGGSTFAPWLRSALDTRSLTVSELARRTGVSRSTVSAWLADRACPSMESFGAIAGALDLDASTVLVAAGIDIVDDDRTARIAELLGKVDRVRLTPDRISGLGGLLDAWIAADNSEIGSAGCKPPRAPLDYVVRFVPTDGRPPIDLEWVSGLGAGNARLLAATAAVQARGERGEVRLVSARGASVFRERIVAREAIPLRSLESSRWDTGPPPVAGWASLTPVATQLGQPAIEQGVPASVGMAKENYVASMHPLAASDNDEQVYTLAEAARLKGVSYHTVSRAVRQGKLPHHRLGRMAFISAANLAAWRPMIERAPKKYARRVPDPAAAPAMLDLASGDRVLLAQRFSILSEILHAAAADQPIGDFLDLLARRFAEALDLHRVSVWELDDRTGSVRRMASFGHPRSASPVDATPGEADAIRELAALESAALKDGSGFAQPAGSLARAATVVAAPLRVGNRTLGLVVADCSGADFDLNPDQLAFAQALANQAALSMEVAEAHNRFAPARI